MTGRITPLAADGTIADNFEAHPNWIIEILSPEQSSTKLTGKILHYLKQGMQFGWLIDPAERSVLVYLLDQKVDLFEHDGDRLPVPAFVQEFQLSIEQLFSWLIVT